MDFCQVRLAGDSTDPGPPRTTLPLLPAGWGFDCRSCRDPHGLQDPDLEVLMQSPVTEKVIESIISSIAICIRWGKELSYDEIYG